MQWPDTICHSPSMFPLSINTLRDPQSPLKNGNPVLRHLLVVLPWAWPALRRSLESNKMLLICALCREAMSTPHRITLNDTQRPCSVVCLTRFSCLIQCWCWGQDVPFKMLLLTQDLLSPRAGGTSSCIQLNCVGSRLLPAMPDMGENGLNICKLVSFPWHKVSETIDTRREHGYFDSFITMMRLLLGLWS